MDVIKCDSCGEPLEAVAAICSPDQARRYLSHVGEALGPPRSILPLDPQHPAAVDIRPAIMKDKTLALNIFPTISIPPNPGLIDAAVVHFSIDKRREF